MKTSPTQRSLKVLRDAGMTAQVVERWNQFAKVRQDLFGFIDIVAIGGGHIVGVQTTTGEGGAMAARRAKILSEPKALAWVKAGGRIVLHGWRKGGKRGEKKTWQVRSEYFVVDEATQKLQSSWEFANAPA